MRYAYSARDRDGKLQRGTIDADNAQSAADGLIARRLSPVQIEVQPARQAGKLSYQDAGRLLSELGRLSKAGIPLETAVRLSAEAHERKSVRSVLTAAASRLADGAGPGGAFSRLSGAAGQAVSAIMAAGERSGRLPEALAAASPLLLATAKFRERIVSRLLYPAIVSVTALAVLIVFLLVVIPALRPVLEGLGDDLPSSARGLLVVSDAAPVVLSGFLFAALAGILAAQSPAVRRSMARARDGFLLSPLGIGLAGTIETALFARLMGALVQAATPVGDAVAGAAEAVSNIVLRERLLGSASSIREGEAPEEALSASLGEQHLIVQACRLGQRGGGFADLIADAGATLSERAESRLERMAALAGPLIILALGLLIGGLVITLFSSLTALPDAALA